MTRDPKRYECLSTAGSVSRDTATEALHVLQNVQGIVDIDSLIVVHTLHGLEALEFLQQRTHDEENEAAQQQG